ncbi:MAG: PQQ-dependent sugar dehydrogenase [Chloroflexi bacterium]|nr:PQQ-dependent sugar dehydrogenase [Chloroflexota bacterium]
MTPRRWLIAILFVGIISLTAYGLLKRGYAQLGGTGDGVYTFEQVVNDQIARPVFMVEPNDGSGCHFLVQQSGVIWVVFEGAIEPEPFLDIQDLVNDTANEQGLLGMALHPDYPNTPYFYLNYTDVNDDTNIVRYEVSANDLEKADPTTRTEILTITQPARNHNGGMLEFGPDGYLYIALGDGGGAGDPQENGQNPDTLLGTILRIDVDNPVNGLPYGIPADNPFADGVDGAPEVFAWGLRNPWRFSFDTTTGDLYIADVGQNQWEEVDYLPADDWSVLNFGWDAFEASAVFEGSPNGDVLMPVAEYDHNQGCSVTGGYVYHGTELPDLQGTYFYGDYCSGIVWTLSKDGNGDWVNEVFLDTDYNISSFAVDLEGELYLIDHGGQILKLVAVNP